MEEPRANTSKHFAIFTSYLQGFYVGELVNQIRQLCFIKGYTLSVIRTGSYGEFNCDISCDHFDAVIIIRNAISTTLADKLVKSGIKLVSIGFDYFPLKIPLITSDHQEGVRLTLEHFKNSGAKKIAFVGDISQYDLRKRYESFCDLLEADGVISDENYLFQTDNTLFAGGNDAAQQFLSQHCDADAILFGSGLTAIGFLQHLKTNEIDLDGFYFVCFDAISLIPVIAPELTSVDPNLHLVAYHAVSTADALLADKECDNNTFVPPKLISVSSDPRESYDSFLATCVDLPELYNANYLKSVISNLHDWPREVVASNLETLMSLAPMFQRYLQRAYLSRYLKDNKGQEWTKLIQIYNQSKNIEIDIRDKQSLCRSNLFPPDPIQKDRPQNTDFLVHIALYVGDKIWGFLSTEGITATPTPASSYFSFTGFMESIADLYSRDLYIKKLASALTCQNNVQEDNELTADKSAIIHWDITKNLWLWSENALKLIGFNSPMEFNVYQNMELTDRVDPDLLEPIRNALNTLVMEKKTFRIKSQIKAKNGQFFDCLFEGEPLSSGEDELREARVYIGV